MSGKKVIFDTALRASVNLQSSKLPTELTKSSTALFSALSGVKATLPDLSYDYNALEPAISAQIMELHHTKHHQTYITNLNAAMEKMDSAMMNGDVSAVIALQGALKFNGGGHINHTLFWENLSPNSEYKEGGTLDKALKERFGSKDGFISELTATSLAIQGSGWGWLVYNPKTKMVDIASCPNQDPVEATTGLKPLLGIDMWEHAFYLDYKNVKPDYVKAIWDVINWDTVEARLEAAK
ncbi:superoxide dismutase [Nitzschia inconspicua]|uniref:Superoxide dismutase n=1 Tax=Nitzschia inconspicua TaxID=303405 RepID=A0A9K3PCG9_9STRA|nr:superoxide dismutase [Nitzschia inconspicua]